MTGFGTGAGCVATVTTLDMQGYLQIKKSWQMQVASVRVLALLETHM